MVFPADTADATYLITADPPVSVLLLHNTSIARASSSPPEATCFAVEPLIVGAPGAVNQVPLTLELESPVPAVFAAATVIVYSTPLPTLVKSQVTVGEVDVQVLVPSLPTALTV